MENERERDKQTTTTKKKVKEKLINFHTNVMVNDTDNDTIVAEAH